MARSADVVEIGVPFTDPMADGLTIQQASYVALSNGVTLEWIFELLGGIDLAAPHLLMGYYNPFLAFGLDRLGRAMAESKTSGLIIPDLPFEENGPLRKILEPGGLALVQTRGSLSVFSCCFEGFALVGPAEGRGFLVVVGDEGHHFGDEFVEGAELVSV